jgi:hypothetical protein
MTSSFTWRTPVSGDGTSTPSRVRFARRGSVPRNLDVFALAFVTLQRHTRQAADGVGYVRVGKARDHLGRQRVENIVRDFFFIDGFGFTMRAFYGHDDDVVFRRYVEDYIQARGLTSRHGNLRGRGRKSDIVDRGGVRARGDVCDQELPLAIGNRRGPVL